MKKKLIPIVLLLCNVIMYGQIENRRIPIKFSINDSLICDNDEVSFEFSFNRDTSRIYITNGNIIIPEFCFKYKEVEMKIAYRDFITTEILRLESIIMNNNVSWSMGFDSKPFAQDKICGLNLNPNDKLIFFWQAKLDEIIKSTIYPVRDNVFNYLFEIEEDVEEEE